MFWFAISTTGLLAKIAEAIFARPYTFRRRTGKGPGRLCTASGASRRKENFSDLSHLMTFATTPAPTVRPP
ncbi:MAG: hypothetical protein ACHQHL_14420, partial [Steroidobacterales bacterium]